MHQLKDPFWQNIRGVCILAVLLIHCPSGIAYDVGTFEFTSQVIIRQIINFPVAIFIFLCGYFVNIEKCLQNPKSYIFARVKRLMIPFILWSLFYTGISLAQDIKNKNVIAWGQYLLKIAVGKASAPLYYIVVLIQLTLLTPFLVQFICKNRKGCNLLYLITPVYLAGIYAYNIITHCTPKLYETFFPAWFCFFYFGIHIKANQKNSISHIEKLQEFFGKPVFVLFTLMFSIGESFFLLAIGCNGNFVTSQIKFGNFLYAFALILWLLQEHKKRQVKKQNLLSHIGDVSYGIYYIHCFFIFIVEKTLSKIGVSQIWLVYYALTWLLVSIISFTTVNLGILILKKQKKGTQLLSWLGFC